MPGGYVCPETPAAVIGVPFEAPSRGSVRREAGSQTAGRGAINVFNARPRALLFARFITLVSCPAGVGADTRVCLQRPTRKNGKYLKCLAALISS